MTITDVSAADSDTSVGRRVATVCGLIGAALAAGAVVVLGDPLRGAGSGAAVTESLVSVAGRSQLAALLAATGGAALVVASVAMGARSAGAYGRLLTIGRGLTALLMAAYFAAFGGGAVVSTQVLDEAGAGVGRRHSWGQTWWRSCATPPASSCSESQLRQGWDGGQPCRAGSGGRRSLCSRCSSSR